MPDITIVMSTARDDYPLLGLPETHLFTPLIESLNKQTFKDFELIIVDSLWEKRDRTPLKNAEFKIKHIWPKGSTWLGKGMFHSANSYNTALLHADSELIVKIDDCMEIESERHLARLWNWYDEGYIPLQAYKYYFKGEPAIYSDTLVDEVIELGNFPPDNIKMMRRNWSNEVYKVGEPVQDTRLNQFTSPNKVVNHEWYYGVSSVPLRNALQVNGYDESMDGYRGLLDVDFGSRLEMNGCNQFLLDRELMLIEHINDALSKEVIKRRVPFLDKYAIYQLNRKTFTHRANDFTFTDQDIEYIREESIKNDTYNEQWFNYWVKNQRTFDLTEMSLEA